MKKIFIILLTLSFFAISCTNTKDKGIDNSRKKNIYETEINILKATTEALDNYITQTENNQDIKKITTANIELLKKMKKLSPEIEAVTKQNPDWEKNPPQEVLQYVQDYMAINEEFVTITLKNIEAVVDAHNDNKELMDSWKKLYAFLTPSR